MPLAILRSARETRARRRQARCRTQIFDSRPDWIRSTRTFHSSLFQDRQVPGFPDPHLTAGDLDLWAVVGKSSRFPVWSMTPRPGHRCAITRRCNDERRDPFAPV